MIFSKLCLENFRQFKGNIEIEFSSDKSITLIIAPIGVGKTTLLQSFRYCFYGDSPNYLKLPNASELLNFSVKNSIRESEEVPFSVTVYFQHDGISYFAKRKKFFVKLNGLVQEKKDEIFELWRSDDLKGYTPLDQEQSELLIRQIMPPGLAHIYMFDGERMEKRVETSEYKNDLKEAIRGILGLKKLEYALTLLGTENSKTKVLGMINSMYQGHTAEQTLALHKASDIGQAIETLEEEVERHNEKITSIQHQILDVQKLQNQITSHKANVARRESLRSDIQIREQRLLELGKDGLRVGSQLLKLMYLAKTFYKYDKFQKKSNSSNAHFQSLHIDTLKDILKNKICICGETIEFGSSKYDHIIALEKHVLPYDNAHYLNKISEEYASILEYKNLKTIADEIKKESVNLRSEIREKQNKLDDVIKQIKELEFALGNSSPQDTLDSLNQQVTGQTTEIAVKKEKIEALTNQLREYKSKIKAITESDSYNCKIKASLDSLHKIKESIAADLRNEENRARVILQKNLNSTLNKVLEGDFSVSINEQFELDIRQKVESAIKGGEDSYIKQTNVLSTGQSVMVSLSFIDSLLTTLDEIKGGVGGGHGILMDAALSNVDEKHISNVCNRVLNHFDQLIFLSIKRHLRNEFYIGIKECIGKCYEMKKDGSGNTKFVELMLPSLNEFIHKMEEGEQNVI